MDIKNINTDKIISKREPEPIDTTSTVENLHKENIRKWLYRLCISAPIISIFITTVVGILNH